jgi:hypothetical protein
MLGLARLQATYCRIDIDDYRVSPAEDDVGDNDGLFWPISSHRADYHQ